jgi:hypothetical protein
MGVPALIALIQISLNRNSAVELARQ